MALEKIEIICQPCPKCEMASKVITEALKMLKKTIPVIRLTNLDEAAKTSVGVAKMPIIRINGKVEFAGQIPELSLLKIRLQEFIQEY